MKRVALIAAGLLLAAAVLPSNRPASGPSAESGALVRWQPWEKATFDRAVAENKPILLDIGAVWCHWCHVMDREDYADPEIAAIVNSRFVPIRVDRDERPDIDRRYQLAVQAIGGSGGWPLTAFLTPSGEVFFGGTYFPPDDGPQGPGFRTLLPRIADFYRGHEKELGQRAPELAGRLAEILRGTTRRGKISETTLEMMETSILGRVDWRNGGFSTSPGPKFPEPGAVEFLLARGARTKNARATKAAILTLDRMAEGGIHDRLGGGFHRYSTDELWRVPHFEKIASDQAALLEAYLRAWEAAGDPLARKTAEGIVDYVLGTLSLPGGGFAASQDADASADDDGGYYTWTRKELQDALPAAQFRIVEPRFGIVDGPARQVLAIREDWTAVSKATGVPPARAGALAAGAIARLRAVRAKRPAPRVNRTLFADVNGRMICAMLDAGRVLGRRDAQRRALASYDLVLDRLRADDGSFFHAWSRGRARIAGLLSDQVGMARAALAVFEVRKDPKDLVLAKATLSRVWTSYRDAASGGFFDAASGSRGENVYLSRPARPVEDDSGPSGNAQAVRAMEDLFALGRGALWRRRARETLDALAPELDRLGPAGGSLGLAGELFLHPPAGSSAR